MSSKQETERLSEYIASDLSPQRSPKGSIFYRRLTTLSSRNHQVTFMSYKNTIQVVKPARKSPRVELRKQRTRAQTHPNTRKNRSGAYKRANLRDSNPLNRFEVTYKKVLSIRSKHLRRSLTVTEKVSLRRSLAKQAGLEEEAFTDVTRPNVNQAQMELIHQQFYYLRQSISELSERLNEGLAFQRCAISKPFVHPVVPEAKPFDFEQIYYEGSAASATNFLAQSSNPTIICDECIQRRLEFLDLKLPYLSDHLERTKTTFLLGNEDQWSVFTHAMGWRRCGEQQRIKVAEETALHNQYVRDVTAQQSADRARIAEEKIQAKLANDKQELLERQRYSDSRAHEARLAKQRAIALSRQHAEASRQRLRDILNNEGFYSGWKSTFEELIKKATCTGEFQKIEMDLYDLLPPYLRKDVTLPAFCDVTGTPR